MAGSVAASWRVSLGVSIMTVVAAGCVLDPGLKHACRTDSDCAAGRVCVDYVCADPVDAGAASAPPALTECASGPADATQLGTPPAPSGRGNYVFVTSQCYVPRFGSLEVADGYCNIAARIAGLPGTYRAWLSTGWFSPVIVNARDRLEGARGWIRRDGAPFADTVVDIVRGRIFYPPLLDEYGREVRGGPAVATGTDGTGHAAGNCYDWTGELVPGGVETFVNVTVGDPQGTMEMWTNDGTTLSCDQPLRLYCFGIDQVQEVAPVPRAGRKAFLSDGAFRSPDGAEAADDLCNREATEAGIPERFVALLATSQMSAADRVASVGPVPWVRLDGVSLNKPGETLFDAGPRVAPLNLTSRMVYMGAIVMTGASGPREQAGFNDNCRDWTSDVTQNSALIGIASYGPGWFGGAPGNCNRDYAHVYCLQKDPVAP